MAIEQMPDDSPATAMFPQFESELYRRASTESQDLTDEQLDFESDRWGWSQWSIRRNLSHMASGDFRWFWVRWRSQLFPNSLPNGEELDRLVLTPQERRLDESVYWELDSILAKLRQAQGLLWSVPADETVGSMKAKEIEIENSGGVVEYPQLFPGGVRAHPSDPSKVIITLETTFRHRYFEHTTHMFNIQRMKRAQGLATRVDLPFEGYHAMPDWDSSEP